MNLNNRLTFGNCLRITLTIAAVGLVPVSALKAQPVSVINDSDARLAWAHQYNSVMKAINRDDRPADRPDSAEPRPFIDSDSAVRGDDPAVIFQLVGAELSAAAAVAMGCGLLVAASGLYMRITDRKRFLSSNWSLYTNPVPISNKVVSISSTRFYRGNVEDEADDTASLPRPSMCTALGLPSAR
jgi:hypothetical protein